ncbi:MAG: DNA-binding domain-containing protein [Pseudomonadota bacterium]|nr:DNA-binding domain-containing protein [Pseudomonadota bacterium]
MSGLRALQEDFLAYLLSGDVRIAGNIVDQAPVGRETRLNIYGNAYRVRLKETLETDHEMLGLYLGDALWDQMADGYIDAHPSHYRSLRQFGDALPEWLRHNPPFVDHPQIAELADFERRLLVSFDAADAARADSGELAALPPVQWPGLRLRFHPSVQPFRADWNSVEIWQALKAGATPPDVILQPDCCRHSP